MFYLLQLIMAALIYQEQTQLNRPEQIAVYLFFVPQESDKLDKKNMR